MESPGSCRAHTQQEDAALNSFPQLLSRPASSPRHAWVSGGCSQNTCLATSLVEAVDDATQGTADVALSSIGVVEEFNAQGQRVLPQVKALGQGAAGQVPHVQAAPKDP